MTETTAALRRSTDAARTPGRPRQRPVRREPDVLDPAVLPDHIDALYRAAWALCGSRVDAEDLVQATFARVLSRPRIVRPNNARAYLLRALKSTYTSQCRALAVRPKTVPLPEDDAFPADESETSSRELMEAVAAAPPLFRDAVIAVDLLGLSYGEAARSLRTREKTIATRLHRGRQHVARERIARGL
jgi:RNA polymerase sigma-70 factor (ECF subfamily)